MRPSTQPPYESPLIKPCKIRNGLGEKIENRDK